MIEKTVAKEPRLKGPESSYYVIVHGIERRRIFETEKDKKDFIDRLETAAPELRTKGRKNS